MWRRELRNGKECCMIGKKLGSRDTACGLRGDIRSPKSTEQDVRKQWCGGKKEVTMT